MKVFFRAVSRALVVLLAPLLIAACDAVGDDSARSVAVRTLSIDPPEMELDVNGIGRASVVGATISLNGVTQSLSSEELTDLSLIDGLSEAETERLGQMLHAIVWSSSDPAVVSVQGTGANTGAAIAEGGFSAVLVGVAVGTADVSAVLAADVPQTLPARLAQASSGVVGTLSVTVRSRTAGSVVASVNESRVPVGTAATMSVVAVLPGEDPIDVTDIAAFEVIQGDDIVSVDGVGNVQGKRPGSATVRVTFGDQEDTVEITVEDVVESIGIEPARNAKVANGDRIAFTASATFTAAGAQDVTDDVTWASSDAQVLSIDATGVAEGRRPGKAIITATLGDQSAGVEVEVSDAVPQSILIRPAPVSVAVGQSAQVTAIVTDTDGVDDPDLRVSWSVSNGALATVSESGFVSGVLAGTTQLVAELGGVQSEVVLSVSQATVSGLSIALPTETTVVPVGARLKMLATARQPTANGVANLSLDPSNVAWFSSHPEVLSVDANGCVEGIKIIDSPVTLHAAYQGVRASIELIVTGARPGAIDGMQGGAPLEPECPAQAMTVD